MVGMMTYPVVFWEAIVWAAALFLLASYLSMLVLTQMGQKSIAFFFFTLICGLALFTRATISFATCLLYGFTLIQILTLQWQRDASIISNLFQNKRLLINALCFGLLVSSLLLFNYTKWGNPFEFYPLEYYKMWDENQKIKYTANGALNLTRIPETISYYFYPSLDNFSNNAPFLNLGSSDRFGLTGIFDYREPTLPITLTQPIATILFILGLFLLPLLVLNCREKTSRTILPSALTSLIPLFFILSIHSLSIRYAGDFLPAIMLFNLFGLFQIVRFLQTRFISQKAPIAKSPLTRFIGTSIMSTLILGSIFLSTAGIFRQNEYWRSLFYYTLIPMESGETVSFSKYGNHSKAVGYLHKGWARDPESFGTWSNTNNPTLLILPPKNTSPENSLIILTKAFVTSNHPEQLVEVWVNGKLNQTVTLRQFDSNEIFIKPLSPINWNAQSWKYLGASLFNKLTQLMGTSNQEVIVIEFQLRNPARPRDLGIGDDNRLLGIGLISATLK